MIKTKLKVAIVSTSLATGGAERFASLLSKMLTKDEVADVHNIIINDAVDFDYQGKLYNLGKAAKSKFSIFKKIEKGFLLYRYLKENNIELIIDNRSRNHFVRELIANRIYGKRKTWYMIHSFNLRNYFPATDFLSKKLYQDSDKLICVSKEIENSVIDKFKFTNTITIYNPFEIPDTATNEIDRSEKFILFFGRLEEKVKNFSLMLDAFYASEIYNQGYSLYILGNGPDLDFIQKKTEDLKLEEFIKMIPSHRNPFEYVSKAKFTILTSRFEGFPMSVIESLAMETPVVSVDCHSGPREIIKSEYNGLLVENHNVEVLSEALKRMINDKLLYQFCKKNASESVAHLNLEAVSKEWMHLLKTEKLYDNKQ